MAFISAVMNSLNFFFLDKKTIMIIRKKMMDSSFKLPISPNSVVLSLHRTAGT
jgi:hypothetical protein